MSLWENRKTIENDKATKWVFVTAQRKLIDLTRKRKVIRKSEEEFKRQSIKTYIGFENQDIIQLCLNQLPAIQKSVVLLRDLEGYNYEEIGQITELSESQVKVYLYRARQKFRDAYESLKKPQAEHEYR